MVKIDFSGKAAVVVGGSSGIGKGIALEFAGCGAQIWIGDLDEKGADATCKEIEALGGKAGFTKIDVSWPQDVEGLYAEAKAKYGRIDIAVNSAGLFLPGDVLEVGPERIKAHLDVNLLGVINGTREALRTMIEQGGGGKILNIASVGGRGSDEGAAYYALGKSGVINFTQSAACTAIRHGINVNSLCPGMVRTPMQEFIIDHVTGKDPEADRDAVYQAMVEERAPLGRNITTEEVAWSASFLCSGYADAIVGQALNVCGGWRMN